MDDSGLRDQLRKLRSELERTATVDEEGRELVRALRKDIDELLQRTAGVPLRPQLSLVRGLHGCIRHFGASQPSLAEALSDVLAALGEAGS
jgi:uncharacterized protein DUF4404